jgi:hypothetical protein
MSRLYKISSLLALMIATTACAEAKSRQEDLAKQSDVWVESVVLDSDSEVRYIRKTRDVLITSVSTSNDLVAPQRIRVGDEIEGVRVGAIQCSFHWRDASYSGEQYMWRGRWACKAGRDRQEVENAVDSEGRKRFDYIFAAPITLRD